MLRRASIMMICIYRKFMAIRSRRRFGRILMGRKRLQSV
ncbi:hypothetical protein Gogos_016579 [Gossypium gossypioides]|uniref:Uncharacterized protein n=1 Tax=Gossypium gossypioides TaxID=34282 RepID=A0A7J9B8I7_GOSGO|nr:hypothetical protein [Gossypium gossypioides]